jgi:Tol biopolymer transport system component
MDTPTPAPTPVGGSGRLVFHYAPQALFGRNANASGDWRGYENIFISDLDGKNLYPLIDGPGDVNFLVGFSPDGRRALVFARPFTVPTNGGNVLADDEQYGSLYTVNLDGSNLVLLTDHFLYLSHGVNAETTAYWLPESERVVFITPDDRGRGIFLIYADGTGLSRLTQPEASPLGPRTAGPCS